MPNHVNSLQQITTCICRRIFFSSSHRWSQFERPLPTWRHQGVPERKRPRRWSYNVQHLWTKGLSVRCWLFEWLVVSPRISWNIFRQSGLWMLLELFLWCHRETSQGGFQWCGLASEGLPSRDRVAYKRVCVCCIAFWSTTWSHRLVYHLHYSFFLKYTFATTFITQLWSPMPLLPRHYIQNEIIGQGTFGYASLQDIGLRSPKPKSLSERLKKWLASSRRKPMRWKQWNGRIFQMVWYET